jgi:hypothetical protein
MANRIKWYQQEKSVQDAAARHEIQLGFRTSEYVESAVSYSDGSLIEGTTGFAIHQTGVGGFGFKFSSPAGVFPAKLSALFIALQQIREVIQPPEKCLILTDSQSSIKVMRSIRRIL